MKLESKALQSMVDAYREEHTLGPAQRRVLERRLRPPAQPRSAWRWSLVGAVAAAAVLLLVVLVRGQAAEQAEGHAPVEASDQAVDPAQGTVVPQDTRTVPAREGPSSDPPPPPDVPTPPQALPPPAPPRKPRVQPEALAPSPADASADALELIAGAQQHLRAGRPSRALQLLEEHGRRFPNASTNEESKALRILALCALGRFAEGRGARSVFLEAYPSSAYRGRVAGACKREAKP